MSIEMTSKSSVRSLDGVSELPVRRVLDVCEALGHLAKWRVLESHGVAPDADTVHSRQAFMLWVADLVERMPVKDNEQRLLLLKRLEKALLGYTFEIEVVIPSLNAFPSVQLGLGDRRYVTMSNIEGKLLDLETGNWISAGTAPPFLERILYDLGRLFTHRYQQVVKDAPA